MKRSIALALAVGFLLAMIPGKVTFYEKQVEEISFTPVELEQPLELDAYLPLTVDEVTYYLETKNSPLANHVETLLEQEHWKLIVAVSAIESQFCIRQLGNNCWGITKVSGGYKSYASFDEGIIDANGLITRWQARGRWHTVEDMNCHYVVPCNPNWVWLVNAILDELETYERIR